MGANLAKDNFFLQLVKTNQIRVSKNGRVWSNRVNRFIGSFNPTIKYQTICLYDKDYGKKRTMLIHRLVWLAHKGKIKDDKLQINHKDGDKLNNKLSNLELVTNRENIIHAYKTGLNKVSKFAREQSSKRLRSSQNPTAKFSANEVIKIRKEFNDKKFTKKELIKKYKVCRRTIENLVKGRTYSYLL